MASRRNLKKKITNIASDLFLVSLMAVSYTHLDVYKRQKCCSPNGIPITVMQSNTPNAK